MNRILARPWIITAAVLGWLVLAGFLDWWTTILRVENGRTGGEYTSLLLWLYTLAPLLIAAVGLALYTWGLPRLPRWLLIVFLALGLLIAFAYVLQWHAAPLLPHSISSWIGASMSRGYLSTTAALLAIGSLFLLLRRANPVK